MAQMIIRNIDDDLKGRLKMRAVLHRCSMEEEAREILRCVLKDDIPASEGLGSRISDRFRDIGLSNDLVELHGQVIQPMDLGD